MAGTIFCSVIMSFKYVFNDWIWMHCIGRRKLQTKETMYKIWRISYILIRWFSSVNIEITGALSILKLNVKRAPVMSILIERFPLMSTRWLIFNTFLGLSGLVALSYFASGVYTVIFERLKLKLQTHNVRLEGQEYSSIYSPIIYIGWFSRKHFLIAIKSTK